MTTIQHPPWCAPPACTATADGRGMHGSDPVTLGPDPRTALTLRLQVVGMQPVDGFPDSGRPIVEFRCTRPAEDQDDEAMDVFLVLGVDSARALADGLTTILDRVPALTPERVS